MGKASSAKKVARAARAGGRRHRQRAPARASRSPSSPSSSSRHLLVVFARQSNRRRPTPTTQPASGDHWHAAYGIYVCDRFVTDLADKGARGPAGHPHPRGRDDPHPPVQLRGRRQAGQPRQVLRPGRHEGHRPTIELPAPSRRRPALRERRDHLRRQAGARSRSSTGRTRRRSRGRQAAKIFTADFPTVRFTEDLGAYTIAFVPEGVTVPAPAPERSRDRQPERRRATRAPAPDGRPTPGARSTTPGRDDHAGPATARRHGSGDDRRPTTRRADAGGRPRRRLRHPAPAADPRPRPSRCCRSSTGR